MNFPSGNLSYIRLFLSHTEYAVKDWIGYHTRSECSPDIGRETARNVPLQVIFSQKSGQ